MCRLCFGKNADLHAERSDGLAGRAKDGFEFDRLAGYVKRKGRTNRKLQRSLESAAGEKTQ